MGLATGGVVGAQGKVQCGPLRPQSEVTQLFHLHTHISEHMARLVKAHKTHRRQDPKLTQALLG